MVITKLALPRRTFIRGIGATVALPFLDAMVPAMNAQDKAAPRFTAIYCWNGANMFDWTPSTEGVGFAMSPEYSETSPLMSIRNNVTGNSSPREPERVTKSAPSSGSKAGFATG